MPILTPTEAGIMIAGVTIIWGITVETWFVSRWTIFFNIVPMIALLAIFDSNAGVIWFMGIFLVVSFFLIGISGWQWAKQLVGAKGYGVFALTFGLLEAKMIIPDQFFSTLGIIGLIVGLCWLVVYFIKEYN